MRRHLWQEDGSVTS